MVLTLVIYSRGKVISPILLKMPIDKVANPAFYHVIVILRLNVLNELKKDFFFII